MKQFSFFFKVLLFTSIFFFHLGNTVAQQTDTTKHISMTVDLSPFVVKGIRVADKAPYATSDLDSQAIQSRVNVRDIPYLLNQIPSVNVTSDAGTGVGYTDIRIRGTDATRINFTMNGVPINNSESQGTFFVNFPDILSSTSSLQVQRGVGASTNGPGAFGASVNMVNTTQGEKPYASVNSAIGSFSTFKNNFKAGTGLLKGGFQFDLRLSKITSAGYIDRASSDLKSLQFISGWASDDQCTSVKFHLLTGIQKTGQAWDGVPEDMLKTHRQYNGLGLMENGKYYADQTDNYQQDFYQLFVNRKFNQYWDGHVALFMTRGKGYYEQYRLNNKFSTYFKEPHITSAGDTLTRTNLVRQLWLDNYFYGTTYALNYQKNKTRINVGGIVSAYKGEHYGFIKWAEYGFPLDYNWYNTPAYKGDYSIYAKLQQQLGRHLFLFADLQYRYVNYRMDGFRSIPTMEHEVDYDFFNPKLGLSYTFDHKYNTSSKLYASFAVAQKEPNRKDFETSAEELPVPEQLYNVELGYNFRSFKWMMGLNAYYMYYKDQLILTGKINDTGAYTRQNVPVSYRSGIEWIGSYDPAPFISLNANATLSLNKIRDFHEYIDDYDHGGQLENVYSSTDIAFSPSVIAFAQARIQPFKRRWEKHNLYLDIIGKHVGRQYLDNTTNRNRSINPYTLTDLRVGYGVKPDVIEKIGISLSLNNVLNQQYESNGYTFSYIAGDELITENYYFPQAGFNFLLALELKF